MIKTLAPFTKQTGQIIRFSQIFISRRSGEVKYTYKEYPVLISNETNLIYHGDFNRLWFLDQKKFKKSDYRVNSHYIVGDVSVYERSWRIASLAGEDGLYSQCYSFNSKKINDRRVRTALQKQIDTEFHVYSQAKSALALLVIK